MKRFLFAAVTLLLTATSFGQTVLTEKEMQRIPSDVRAKVERMLKEDASQIAYLTNELRDERTTQLRVEDGQILTVTPPTTSFLQLSRDREAPEEGNYVYSRWCDLPDVSAAYISPEMFRMMEELPKINISDRRLDLSSIVTDLKGLYLLDFARYRHGDKRVSYSRNTTAGGLRRDIRDFLDQGHYTTLMDLRQNGQYTRLYVASTGTTVTGFVLVNLDDEFDYGRFVCLEGRIPRDKFEALLKKVLK